MMTQDKNTHIVRGSANIFEDLGYADVETHLLKAKLASRIQGAITAQKLTQVAAANAWDLFSPTYQGCSMANSATSPWNA